MSRASVHSKARLLYAEMRLVCVARWVLGACALALGAAGLTGAAPDAHAWRLIGLGGVILGAGAALALSGVMRPRIALRYPRLLSLAVAQCLFDVACLSVLVAWTGGLHSPALFLFLPQSLFFAGMLLPIGKAGTLVAASVAGAAAGVAWSGAPPSTPAHWVFASIWVVSLIATFTLAARVTGLLHERDAARAEQVERIGAMSAELSAQHGALLHGEKLVAMGQMAAGIAHEITNPLAAMDSVLQLMQRRPEHPRPDAVNTLREQVQRILRIVRQLTSYAHPSRGIVDSVSINEVVRSAAELLGFSRRTVDVHVLCGIPEPQAMVRLNPQAVQQVITNLLVNALDAVATTPNPRIDVRTAREGSWCVIEVSDNGAGIAPEHMTRIFEPFFTTKPVGQGTGLGLSICSRLVEEQQGHMEVESTPGQGTTFRVLVPAAPQPHPVRTPAGGHELDAHAPTRLAPEAIVPG